MAKVRNGFVSNSSSSSFIIAAKGELNKERMIGILGVPEISPLHAFAEEIASALMNVEPLEGPDLVEALEYEDGTILPLLKAGFDIYEGSASDDEWESGEALLCRMTLNYKSDDLIIIKDGGY